MGDRSTQGSQEGAGEAEDRAPYDGAVGLYLLVQQRETELRGRLLSYGTDPDTLGFRDWLDAGERMLFDSAREDAVLLDILLHITRAESQAIMEAGFTELGEYAEHRSAEFQKEVSRARKEAGLMRATADEELAAAEAEWDEIVRSANPDPPGGGH